MDSSIECLVAWAKTAKDSDVMLFDRSSIVVGTTTKVKDKKSIYRIELAQSIIEYIYIIDDICILSKVILKDGESENLRYEIPEFWNEDEEAEITCSTKLIQSIHPEKKYPLYSCIDEEGHEFWKMRIKHNITLGYTENKGTAHIAKIFINARSIYNRPEKPKLTICVHYNTENS